MSLPPESRSDSILIALWIVGVRRQAINYSDITEIYSTYVSTDSIFLREHQASATDLYLMVLFFLPEH